MVFNFATMGFVIGLIWLIVLTVLYIRQFAHYNNLTKGSSTKTLKSILDELLTLVHANKKDIDLLQARCATIEKQGLFHIQKIGLMRFNPFKDTGGDQSFILTFVDARNSGVIITGLYSRSGTRWYAKRVVDGKAIEHELSDDEKKALKETKYI